MTDKSLGCSPELTCIINPFKLGIYKDNRNFYININGLKCSHKLSITTWRYLMPYFSEKSNLLGYEIISFHNYIIKIWTQIFIFILKRKALSMLYHCLFSNLKLQTHFSSFIWLISFNSRGCKRRCLNCSGLGGEGGEIK